MSLTRGTIHYQTGITPKEYQEMKKETICDSWCLL